MNRFPNRSRSFELHLSGCKGCLIKCCRSRCSGDDEAGRVVLDGSKVKANASKQRHSYGGYSDEKRLQAEVKSVGAGGKVDVEEDAVWRTRAG